MITPMDIHNKTFTRKLRGYAEDEVNSFLEEVVSDYERIYREHREIEEQMDAIKSKLSNYEKMEATMSATLVMAQEMSETVKQNAAREAELIVREARAKAEKILAEADSTRRSTNEAVMRTENDMRLYMEKILANLNSAKAMLEEARAERAPRVEDKQPAPAPAPEAAPAAEAAFSPAETAAAEAAAREAAAAEGQSEEAAPVEAEAVAPASAATVPAEAAPEKPMSDVTREILSKIFPEEAEKPNNKEEDAK